MPIVNHVIEANQDTTIDRHVVLRLMDQDGQQYTISFWWPANMDLTAAVNTRIAELNEQLAQNEFEAFVGAA